METFLDFILYLVNTVKTISISYYIFVAILFLIIALQSLLIYKFNKNVTLLIKNNRLLKEKCRDVLKDLKEAKKLNSFIEKEQSKLSQDRLAFEKEKEDAAKKIEQLQKSIKDKIRENNEIAEKKIQEAKILADREIRSVLNRIRPYDVEKELDFLLYLVDTEISKAIKFRLNVQLLQNERQRGFLKDTNIGLIAEEIVVSIFKQLSEIYKEEVLYRYVSKDNFLTFLSEMIYTALLSQVIAINNGQLAKLRARTTMEAIRDSAKEQVVDVANNPTVPSKT